LAGLLKPIQVYLKIQNVEYIIWSLSDKLDPFLHDKLSPSTGSVFMGSKAFTVNLQVGLFRLIRILFSQLDGDLL